MNLLYEPFIWTFFMNQCTGGTSVYKGTPGAIIISNNFVRYSKFNMWAADVDY